MLTDVGEPAVNVVVEVEIKEENNISKTIEESTLAESVQENSNDSCRPPLSACICLGLIALLSGFYMTMDSIIYVLVANEFNAFSKAQWILNSTLIASTACQPVYGKLSDIFGRRSALFLASAFLGLGSILCASSKSINMFIASRVIEGFGSSGIVTMLNVIIADMFGKKTRAGFMGIIFGISGMTSVGGTALGGYLIQRSAWRYVYWINAGIAATFMLITFAFIRPPSPPPAPFRDILARIDFGGAIILPVGIVFILVGLSLGGHDYPWASARVICFLAVGFLVVLAFFFYEKKVPKEPIFPVRLLRTRNVAFSFVGNLFLGAVIYGPFAFIPMWALVVRNATPIVSNLYTLPFTILECAFALISGWLVGVTGRYREFIWAGGIALLIGTSLFILFDQHASLGMIIGIQLIAGIGSGTCAQIIIFTAQVATSSNDSAVVTSICIFLRTIGSVIVVAVLSSVNNNILHSSFNRLSDAYPEYKAEIRMVSENQSLIGKLDLPQFMVDALTSAFIKGIHGAFIALIPFSALFVLSTFGFKHIALGKTRLSSP